MTTNIANTFQHPNWNVDQLMYLLTPEQNVVLTFITRHILGWEKERLERKRYISLSMMTDGWSDESGNTYHGTGLGLSANRNAAKALVGFGIIKAHKANQKGTLYELPTKPDLNFEAMQKCYDERQQKRITKTIKATAGIARKRASDQPLSSDDTPIVERYGKPIVTRTPTPIVTQQESNPPNPTKKKEDANASVAAGDARGGENSHEKKPTLPESKEAVKEPTPRPRDLMFEAIAIHLFRQKQGLFLNGGRVGKTKKAVIKEFPTCTPVDIENFSLWWDSAYKGASRPKDPEKVVDALAEYFSTTAPPGEAAEQKSKFKVEYLPDPDDPNTMIQIKTAVEAQ